MKNLKKAVDHRVHRERREKAGVRMKTGLYLMNNLHIPSHLFLCVLCGFVLKAPTVGAIN